MGLNEKEKEKKKKKTNQGSKVYFSHIPLITRVPSSFHFKLKVTLIPLHHLTTNFNQPIYDLV